MFLGGFKCHAEAGSARKGGLDLWSGVRGYGACVCVPGKAAEGAQDGWAGGSCHLVAAGGLPSTLGTGMAVHLVEPLELDIQETPIRTVLVTTRCRLCPCLKDHSTTPCPTFTDQFIVLLLLSLLQVLEKLQPRPKTVDLGEDSQTAELLNECREVRAAHECQWMDAPTYCTGAGIRPLVFAAARWRCSCCRFPAECVPWGTNPVHAFAMWSGPHSARERTAEQT